MGREEQNEEREVLSAIFPDEIVDLSESSFRVSVVLDESVQDGEGPPPTLLLTVTFPPDYPDVAPNLDLSAPPNATKHTALDVQEDRATLLAALDEPISDNLGMQMVFTLVSTLKDSAELLIAERRAAQERLKEIEAQKVEEAENAKFHGEKVTVESFMRWRDGFRKEMEEEERRRREEAEAEVKGKRGAGKEDKLTGKQLWERGLVGKVDEDEDDEGDGTEDVVAGVKEVKV